MKILVISESINVEDSSASKVNTALIANLYKAGFELKVLHYSHKKIDLENVETILIKENRTSLLFFPFPFCVCFSEKDQYHPKLQDRAAFWFFLYPYQ